MKLIKENKVFDGIIDVLFSTYCKFNEGQSARFSLTTLTSSLLKFATPGQEGNVQTSSRAAVDWIESECAFTLETTKDALPPSLG